MSNKKNNKNVLFQLPSAVDVEDALLGIMMLNHKTIAEVKEILEVEDFYDPKNTIICKAIFELHVEGCIPDLLTVNNRVKSYPNPIKVEPFEITAKTIKVTGLERIDSLCRIVKEKSIARQLLVICSNITASLGEKGTDVFDILDETKAAIGALGAKIQSLAVTRIFDVAANVINQFMAKVNNARQGIENPNAVRTFIEEWDAVNGDLVPALYVVAGRPAMGKGVHLTELCVRMGKVYNIGVVNGEMTHEQLLIRCGCNLKRIDNFLWKKDPKQITDEELRLVQEAMEEAANLKLFLYDETEIHKICNRISLWVSKDNVKCVLIDFLTLLKVNEEVGKYFSDTQRVNYIMDMLRNTAKKEKIPIILYCQLNRDLTKRDNKEPRLSDLKQSGNIEEFAYQVSFLHRPEYYDDNPIDEHGNSLKGLMYQIIAKHRDGELARLKFSAKLAQSRLEPYNDTPMLPSSLIPSTVKEWLPPSMNHSLDQTEEDDTEDWGDQPF